MVTVMVRAAFSAARFVAGSKSRMGWWYSVPVALCALPLWAQEVPVTPEVPADAIRGFQLNASLTADETYTDNVQLKPAGFAQKDFVTRITPSISFRSNGPRARFSGSYAIDMVNRANEQSSDTFHYLSFLGNVDLVQRLLYVDLDARIAQQTVSLLGAIGDSSINNSGNRSSVSSYSVSPYLRHDFSQEARGELRFTYRIQSANSSAAALEDRTTDRIDLSLKSGAAFRRVTWDLAASREHVSYDVGRENEIQKVSAGATAFFLPTLGLKGKIGVEKNDYFTFGEKVDGLFWSVGPEWTPTPRSRFVATFGKLFDKSTYALDFSHRSRLTTWSLDYGEEITTQSQQVTPGTDLATYLNNLYASTLPDPLARDTAVKAYIDRNGLQSNLIIPVNAFTITPYLQKRLRASMGLLGVRNTIIANFYVVTRESKGSSADLGAGDFALSQNIKQTGGGVVWTWQMAPRTTANLTAGYSRNEFSSVNREDRQKTIRFGLTHQLATRTSASLTYRRIQNNSTIGSAATYAENAFTAALSLRY